MRQMALVCITILGITASNVATANNQIARYVPGQDYELLRSAVYRPDSARVHVKEFFLYSCPHCFEFEPRLDQWIRHLGADVQFSYSPVLFSRGSRTYARIYHTERALGIVGRLHDTVYAAIHRQNRPLGPRVAIRGLFKANGISNKRFKKTFDSHTVTKSMHQASRRMRRFGVRSEPSLAVADRCWISGRTAGSNQRMLQVADYLIAKTRRARQSKESK